MTKPITKLQWAAKKEAYLVFRLIPKERSQKEKDSLEEVILLEYERYGVPAEYYSGEVIIGKFS